jgi:hypothetical protein
MSKNQCHSQPTHHDSACDHQAALVSTDVHAAVGDCHPLATADVSADLLTCHSLADVHFGATVCGMHFDPDYHV